MPSLLCPGVGKYWAGLFEKGTIKKSMSGNRAPINFSAPPSYNESQVQTGVDVKDSDDDENTQGNYDYRPKYLTYNLPAK